MIKPTLFFLTCIASFLWGKAPEGYEEIEDQCTIPILTPSFENRKTAKIRLHNGLEAYLISDPEAKQSAAALCVGVGSWNDAPAYPGIAHFVEHLLLMGSKTYPEENGYAKQVNDNQGICNAYTAATRTVYTFSVNNDAFLTTLDLFSHQFIDPLFSPSGVERELHAIDQEHDKNIQNDSYKFWMILKEIGNPKHPNALFNTGNLETLRGIPLEEVKKWYETYYSSDRSYLAVYSPLSIEDLKAHTLSLFSSFPRAKEPFPPLSKEPLFSHSQAGHLIVMEPHQKINNLILTWELPLDVLKSSSPYNVLAALMNKTHPSSLYTELKSEGLIEGMECNTSHLSENVKLLSIGFCLTPEGVKAFESVIERCFQTLHFLKTCEIPSYLFEEMQAMAKRNYQFQSRIHPYILVERSASDLIHEPLETYPLKTRFPTDFSQKDMDTLLDNLTPQKAMYCLVAPSVLTGMSLDKKEKWTHTPYAVYPIAEETLNRWTTASAHPNLALPQPNPFLPKQLNLVTSSMEKGSPLFPTPVKLLENDQATVYFWQDDRYQIPKISWILDFHTPLIDGSARQHVLSDLFCLALDETLSTTLSFAHSASLYLNTLSSGTKLSIELDGYSEKGKDLLDETLKTFKGFSISKEEFDFHVSILKKGYENFENSPPLKQALDLYYHLFFNTYQKASEKLAALDTLTYEDFLFFQAHLFDQYYLKATLGGNLTEQDARQVLAQIEETLKGDDYPIKNHTKTKQLSLPQSDGPFKICEKTDAIGNVACLLVQEGEVTFKRAASHLILTTALKEDFFDTLRTKQQTGYTVGIEEGLENQTELDHLFFVQSSTHEPEELLSRFELFLETYLQNFENNLSEGRFEVIKRSRIAELEMPPSNLSNMVDRLHTLAFGYNENFTLFETLIHSLKNLTYDQLKQDALSFFSRKNLKRVAILLEGKQIQEKGFRYQKVGVEELKQREKKEVLPAYAG